MVKLQNEVWNFLLENCKWWTLCSKCKLNFKNGNCCLEFWESFWTVKLQNEVWKFHLENCKWWKLCKGGGSSRKHRSGFTSTRPGLPQLNSHFTPTGSDAYPTGFRCSVHNRPVFPPTRSGSVTPYYGVRIHMSTDRVSVWTDRSSFISTTTCASNKFSGRIHLHCWHHLLTLSLGHTLLMVEYPELALFRIHAFDPVGCCKLHFSSPDRFFFQTDRVHTCAQKALDCFF